MLLEKIDEIVSCDELIKGYRIYNGFIFKAIRPPFNVFDAIFIRHPITARKNADMGLISSRTLEEHIELINKYGIEQAIIIADDISFLDQCLSLKHLNIFLCENANLELSFSKLYDLPEILSLQCCIKGRYESEEAKLDYSKIRGLLDINITYNKDIRFQNASNLKNISISEYNCKNLNELFCSKDLDTLEINTSKIHSLDGIENAPKMQCLYLSYNRQLQDITKLKTVKNTLKELKIEKCPRITDFTVLSELKELEYLYLKGSNKIQNLDFIYSLPKLKTFIFDIEVEDGNLLPCLNLSYVRCGRIRKNYNLKEKDLPKGLFCRGNENIEVWRRVNR